MTDPGPAETLPSILRRRYGIPERRTYLAALLITVLLAVVIVLLRDPLDGKAQRVHASKPVFNTLYTAGVVEPVRPHAGELQRYEARRGPMRISIAIRPVDLPAYQGDVSGLLPVYTQRHIEDLRRELPGFELLTEGRARFNKAPGYAVEFRYGKPGNRTSGQDAFVVPPDEPGARDGVIVSYREHRGAIKAGPRTFAVVKAARSAFRSFKYGSDRDD